MGASCCDFIFRTVIGDKLWFSLLSSLGIFEPLPGKRGVILVRLFRDVFIGVTSLNWGSVLFCVGCAFGLQTIVDKSESFDDSLDCRRWSFSAAN